jgi:hypothetical protein
MGKIIVTGPGRSGTTFIMQLLTRLGFDTSFKPYHEPVRNDWRAGCEFVLSLDMENNSNETIKHGIAKAPRVLKSCDWAFCLKFLLSNELIEVDHVIVPFRDLDVAAQSRIAAGLHWLIDPNCPNEHLVQSQANVHGLALGRVTEACLLFGIPMYLPRFPAIVQDEQYCYECISKVGDVDREEHRRVWGELANPDQIEWGVNGNR